MPKGGKLIHGATFGSLRGLKREALYGVWKQMKQRCSNPKHQFYKNYGGKGVDVCQEWSADYALFRDWAWKNGYAPGMSIERNSNSLGYNPDNCKWLPRGENSKHRDNRIMGGGIYMSEVAERLGIKYHTLYMRIKRQGMTLDEAIQKPFRKSRCLTPA